MTPPHTTHDHESAEGRIANVAQARFGLLFLHPDEATISIPRTWSQAASQVRGMLTLEQLRHPH